MSSYQNLGRESNSKNAASPSSPRPEHAGVQILSPDRGGIEKFVNAMFRHVGSEGFVSLRSFYDDRNERFRILAVSFWSFSPRPRPMKLTALLITGPGPLFLLLRSRSS